MSTFEIELSHKITQPQQLDITDLIYEWTDLAPVSSSRTETIDDPTDWRSCPPRKTMPRVGELIDEIIDNVVCRPEANQIHLISETDEQDAFPSYLVFDDDGHQITDPQALRCLYSAVFGEEHVARSERKTNKDGRPIVYRAERDEYGRLRVIETDGYSKRIRVTP